MRTSLNHQPEVHHPKSPAIRWAADYPIYVQDPWGSYSEYSADIDYVPATCDWQGGDQDPDDSFYAWGPNVPEDFVHNYEA
jgi:catechol 2,3-dioxygenase